MKTRDITVKVLGTSFNVKSYADDNATEATLVTGKVEIIANRQLRNRDNTGPVFLEPNQKAVFTRDNRELSVGNLEGSDDVSKQPEVEQLKVVVQEQIKTDLETSWKNNILIFNSEPFGEIVRKLERWYNVEVDVKYVTLAPVVFSGKFDKESVDEVLHALSLIEPFRYEINKNRITIYK
ncbi:MAG: DUF4974 domain-containing protein [Bacteroidetes bacterium]|nr:DUF4974 domain-containing protein [Bacteroidota bacterium]